MHVSLRVFMNHKMVYSEYVMQRIRNSCMKCAGILQCQAEKAHTTTKASVCKFIRLYEETGMITRTIGSGQAMNILADKILQIVSHLVRLSL